MFGNECTPPAPAALGNIWDALLNCHYLVDIFNVMFVSLCTSFHSSNMFALMENDNFGCSTWNLGYTAIQEVNFMFLLFQSRIQNLLKNFYDFHPS